MTVLIVARNTQRARLLMKRGVKATSPDLLALERGQNFEDVIVEEYAQLTPDQRGIVAALRATK